MKKILKFILQKPLLWIANKLSAAPRRDMVFESLSTLYTTAINEKDTRVKLIIGDADKAKYIVFSDQHKGDKSPADDFANNEDNYINALHYYNNEQFTFINLGDSEELWKFSTIAVLKHNEKSFIAEAAFEPNRFYKTFGNHDIIWKNWADVFLHLRKFFTMPLVVHEGIVIQLNKSSNKLNIFLTHGHQGDAMSDNNKFSTWIIAHIWLPLQRYLQININTPSKDFLLRNKHNVMMSEWSAAQQNVLLITGHTHAPVFASGKYYNHPSNHIPKHNNEIVKPTYFNTGCCCFSDGDITGIEIADGYIRLIKWHTANKNCSRIVLEEVKISTLILEI